VRRPADGGLFHGQTQLKMLWKKIPKQGRTIEAIGEQERWAECTLGNDISSST
jgi:hypothetical protein